MRKYLESHVVLESFGLSMDTRFWKIEEIIEESVLGSLPCTTPQPDVGPACGIGAFMVGKFVSLAATSTGCSGKAERQQE